jgi:hypothetical protein
LTGRHAAVKRSHKIGLVLLGSASLGALTGCAPDNAVREPRISPESVYANNQYIAGAGYYHAPFQRFYPQPYNYYDAVRKQYFFGGEWGPVPHRSVINVSAPTDVAARLAEASRAAVAIQRGGFGSTSGGHRIWS